MIFKLLAMTTLLMMGCAPKSTPVPTEFVISSMVQALATSSNGGLYFAGRSSSGEEFSLGLANSSNLNLVLNQGQWTFYTIAWEGPEPMTGEHRCDITQATLAPGNQTVSIELAKTKCVDGRFGRIDVNPALSAFTPSESGQAFKRLNLNPCLDVSLVTEQGQNCRGLAGTTYSHPMKGENISFQVSIRSRTLPGMVPRQLMSTCIGPTTAGDFSQTFYSTDLRLPIGGSFQGLLYDIYAFEDPNCGKLEAIYRLPPVTRNIAGSVFRLPQSSLVQSENTLYFADNYVGNSIALLQNKRAVFGCGLNGDEHCFPSVPLPRGVKATEFEQLSYVLERIISNATERESNTYGAKAGVHLTNGMDIKIESTTAGNFFNNYSVQFNLNPIGGQFVDISLDIPQNRIVFLVNPNAGTCSVGGFFDESTCVGNSGVWSLAPPFYNDAIEFILNDLFAAQSVNLQATTDSGASTITPASIIFTTENFMQGQNPSFNSGRMDTVLSRIAFYTSGPYMSVLAGQGILSCEAIPTSGAIERTFAGVRNHSVRLEFGTGSKSLPLWLNSGTPFDKRIRFVSGDGEVAILEYSCANNAQGFLRVEESNRVEEYFWKTESQLDAQIEIYRTSNSPSLSVSEVTRFKKLNAQQFEVVSSQSHPAQSSLIKARGTKNALWINSTNGYMGNVDMEEVATFESDNSGVCFNPAGSTSGANCAGIESNVSIAQKPFYQNSWTTGATLNWNNPQFFDCPREYIPIQGSPLLGTTNFCVMKYEARNSGIAAASTPIGLPGVSLSRNQAKTRCSSSGANYSLIDNLQWMTIAHAIELNPANWTTGIVGEGKLFIGHSKPPPSNLCDSTQIAVNTSCAAFNSLPERKRVHVIGNHQIWDFAGNAKEWVDWDIDYADKAYVSAQLSPSPTPTFIESVDTNAELGDPMDAALWKPLNPSLGFINGIGKYTSGAATTGAAIRGGSFNSDEAGIYALDFHYSETDINALVGYRCVYAP